MNTTETPAKSNMPSANEERLRLAQQVGRAGTFEWNIQTGVNTWTPELEAMYGLVPGSFGKTQRNWELLVHPDDRVDATRAVTQAVTSFEPIEAEWRVIWPDGSVHWLVGRFQAFKDASGVAHRLIGVNVDITEHKRAEHERHRSSARLQLLSRSSNEFATATAQGVLSLIGVVAKSLSEVVGDGCTIRLVSREGTWLDGPTAVHHQDIEKREAIRELLARQRQRVGEGFSGKVVATVKPLFLPKISLDGLKAQLPADSHALLEQLNIQSMLAVPLKTPDRVLGVLTMIRGQTQSAYSQDDLSLVQDLADRAALAIQNALLLTELEVRVLERTEALQEVNQELESFCHSVSHDLRAPLRIVQGFSKELLSVEGEKLGPQAREYVERIQANMVRMSNMVDDLLSFTRLARDEMKLERVDLTALAISVAKQIENNTSSRSVKFTAQSELFARGDPKLIAVVFEHLLSNAWKFTAQREAAEVVFGRTHDGSAFFVRDNGAGFDIARAGKLFGPFRRFHRQSENPEGTGIGLATVHRIVTRHGGRVWVDAKVDQGTTVFFTLGPSTEPQTLRSIV